MSEKVLLAIMESFYSTGMVAPGSAEDDPETAVDFLKYLKGHDVVPDGMTMDEMNKPRLTGWWIPEGEALPQDAWERIRDELPAAIAEGKQVVMVGGVTLRWYPAPDSLDAAWAEAEAALPEGYSMGGIIQRSRSGDHWQAVAMRLSEVTEFPNAATVEADGPNPAAALRALAAELRKPPTP